MIEDTILASLVYNDTYTRKVLPFLNREYFETVGQQIAFKLAQSHFLKYNKCPTIESLLIDLQSTNLAENSYNQADSTIRALVHAPADLEWLVDNTEEFCKKKALFSAISSGANLMATGDSTQYNKMLQLVQDALAVTFDNHIGHDYLEDAEFRYNQSQVIEQKLRCDLDAFNSSLRGGFVNQSLTVFLAPTGVGKSMILGHFSTSFLMGGRNVLYITMEMPELQVSERLDAHLLDVAMEDLPSISKSKFLEGVLELKKKTSGRLVIKEYPAHSAHSGHFRHLIMDLKLKKNFKPDVIVVDYMGICGSALAPKGANSYEFLKTVAIELRALGQEFNCRVFTAMQVNKEGSKTNDFEIYDTAESWGVPAQADYMFGLISTAEMEESGQMKIKRLKDRHNDKNKPASFMLGMDRSKMRFYDIEQQGRDETAAPFSNSKFGSLIV